MSISKLIVLTVWVKGKPGWQMIARQAVRRADDDQVIAAKAALAATAGKAAQAAGSPGSPGSRQVARVLSLRPMPGRGVAWLGWALLVCCCRRASGPTIRSPAPPSWSCSAGGRRRASGRRWRRCWRRTGPGAPTSRSPTSWCPTSRSTPSGC